MPEASVHFDDVARPFSDRTVRLREALLPRLLSWGNREGNNFGPDGDGKTPFLDAFEQNPGRPLSLCYARGLVDSWMQSTPHVEPGEILVGIPRPKRPCRDRFAWGIRFGKKKLEQPAYRARASDIQERYEKLSKRINPLTGRFVRDEGEARFGSAALDALNGSLWTVAGYQGHTVPGYGKLLHRGIKGIVEEIAQYGTVHQDHARVDLIHACETIYRGLSEWILQYARFAETVQSTSDDPSLAVDAAGIAETCRAIAWEPPGTLRQACQLLLFMALWDNIDSLGRVDQYLYPFYRQDIEQDTIDDDGAYELISALWLKFLEYGVHNITLGGQTSGKTDATNPLTVMGLEASRFLHETHPRLTVRIHAHTPPRLLGLCTKMWSEGMSDPTLVYDESVLKAYAYHGVDPDDALDYTLSACQEIEIPGKSNLGSEDATFNLAKCLELALHDGRCRITGLQLGPQTGVLEEFDSFDDLWKAYTTQVEFFARHCIELSNRGAKIRSANLAKLIRMPLTEDCLKRCLDPDNGGARYGFGEIETAGIGAAADALTALRMLVFEQKAIGMNEIAECLADNFEGHEATRQRLLNAAPKYGNDNEIADEMACRVAHHFWTEIGTYKSGRGGAYFGATSLLARGISFGKRTAALPDGRRMGEPLGNSIGPRTGVDTLGPTAMLRSAAKLPQHLAIGGPSCNVSLPQDMLSTPELRDRVAALVQGYFEEGGTMLQVTPVDRQTLVAARSNPEQYRDVIVRVGGFSIKFVDLAKDAQDELIMRSGMRDG